MSHVNDDGGEQPVYIASRTLHSTERNYAQIDWEALAIMLAVQKFRRYLIGRKFTIYTDHQPLLGLLSKGKPIRDCASPRMLRWSLWLSNFDYELRYRPGKQMGGADALSRLPLPYNEREIEPQPPEVFLLEIEPHGPFSPADIAQATDSDPTLTQVRAWVTNGWPNGKLLPPFSVFNQHRQSMSVQKNCVLFGNRVLIPSPLRRDVLKMLHAKHHVIVATMAIARSYIWWPGISTDIEKIVTNCSTCLAVRPDPPRVLPSPWPTIDQPA
uniref:RNA-directed DNA polymerase n=1 Tax=Trichuris muris TaxID=70415 RepID=A0A5S6QW21_TRIMR